MGRREEALEHRRDARRMVRRILISKLALVFALASSAVDALRSRAVLWPFMTQSVKLFVGTLAYNAFALFLVQPLLKHWFPPLKPWEHVTGLFGDSRMTYQEIVPAVATTLWILGNALLVVLMNRNLRNTRETIAAGGAMTADLRPRPGR
jgi:hypothetical protein